MPAKLIKAISVLTALCYGIMVNAQATLQFEPVAVIELFTSEGCSSCPPADKLLAETIKDAAGDKKIFGLAFHVDYWNRLGWRDSFSTKQFSDRQGIYAEGMHLNGVYTPQIVVNGTTEFVGSDRASLSAALLKALNKKSAAQFGDLRAALSGNDIHVSYVLTGDFGHSHINIALVSAHKSTSVKSGENRGRQLEHANVVRQFKSVKAAASGTVQFDNIPKGEGGNLFVIAYVQQDKGLNIIGAASAKP